MADSHGQREKRGHGWHARFATCKKLPRDIVVQFMTQRKKEEILKKHFENPLEIDNKKVLILKEVPRKALLKIKNYKKNHRLFEGEKH